jgi:WD40 repeat protein
MVMMDRPNGSVLVTGSRDGQLKLWKWKKSTSLFKLIVILRSIKFKQFLFSEAKTLNKKLFSFIAYYLLWNKNYSSYIVFSSLI